MLVGWYAANDKTELVDTLGMFIGCQNANLPSLGFSDQVRLFDPRRVHEIE